MAKLYPPVLAGTIPAFGGTSIIEVPFSMSRAVSVTEVSGLVLKIKKISGATIGTVKITDCPNPAVFRVAEFNLAIGEFYKVQLAYIDLTGEVGYFSTVAIVKCTSMPYVAIEGLSSTHSNNHNYVYTGLCRQASYDADTGVFETGNYDTSEKLYSSRFYIYDENNKVIKDTGEVLHSTHSDVSSYEATDTFEFHNDFEIDKPYYIEYVATTSNGLIVASPRYKLHQRRLRPMVLDAHLEVKNDFDAGVIQVDLVQDTDELASGLFLLSRSSSKAPNKWEPMKEFALQSEYPNRVLYKDYTVEQGITYRYALQQYNNHNIYSERRISEEVVADFEDLFLFDGTRQLAVRFNPKVTTFKENRVEQKTETIGNKYPFIIKNGSVGYKELSISGLISYQMDAIEQFMKKDDLDLPYNPHDKKRYDLRDLITENIKAERLFKTEVLAWLNNGGIKLYRSPTEGNFVVRLMNVTTTPTDQLGRMLHTFNCAAYEMASSDYDSLIQFGILEPAINTPKTMRWKTVELRETAQRNAESSQPKDFIQLNYGLNLGIENIMDVYTIDFEGMAPGSYFLAGTSPADCKKFFIGATGSYHFVTDYPFQYVAIPAKLNDKFIEYSGSFTFGYKGWVKSSFDLITEVDILDEAGKRFIGNAYSIKKGKNIFDYLADIKSSVLAVKYMKLYPRELHSVYYDESEDLYYLTEEDRAHGGIPYTGDEIIDQLNILNLYKVRRTRTQYENVGNEDYYLDVSDKETPEYISQGRLYVYLDPYYYYWRKIHNRLSGYVINGNYFTSVSDIHSYLSSEMANKIASINTTIYDTEVKYQNEVARLTNYYGRLINYHTQEAQKNISVVSQCKVTATSDMELYKVTVDNETINMWDVFSQTYHGMEDIMHVSIGAGVILDIGYQLQKSTYNFELEDPVLHSRYVELFGTNGLLNRYTKERQKLNATDTSVNSLLAEYYQIEEIYLEELTVKVENYKQENNLNE